MSSTRAWEKTRINLGEEGELVQLLEAQEEPSDQKALSAPLSATFLLHNSCGLVKQVQVSSSRMVIFCPNCGLRLTFSAEVSTVGQLQAAIQQ